jgi:hypothetical protein
MNLLSRPLSKLLLLAVAGAVSWGVFVMYTRPAFLQILANQLWGCL